MVNSVRRAKESDIPAIMELLKQVNWTHYNGRPDLFNLTTKYPEDELRAIAAKRHFDAVACAF